MKINLIGMILNNAGRRCFDGALLNDDGKPMPAADSLHTLIMEYAKVVNGGASAVVTTSREVTTRQCETCRHKNVDQRESPCVDCFGCAKWVARQERPNNKLTGAESVRVELAVRPLAAANTQRKYE